MVSSVFCLRYTSSQIEVPGRRTGGVVPQLRVFNLHITEFVAYRLCSLEAAARRSKLLCLEFSHNISGARRRQVLTKDKDSYIMARG